MATLSKSMSAVRFSRQCLASTSRVRQTYLRSYATADSSSSSGLAPASIEEHEMFANGPPPPKVTNQVIMKRYVGKGFPKIPGLRHLVHPHHPHLHPGGPLRELTIALRRKGGRNNSGQVVNRGIGGGHKQRLRVVDFYRHESGIHDVVRIEYDPGRSAHIALIHRRGAGKRADVENGAALAEKQSGLVGGTTELRKKRNEVKGGWSYILAPDGLRAGDVVQSFRSGIPKGFIEGWVNPNSTKSSSTPTSDPSSPQTVDDPAQSSTTRALGLLRTLTLKPGNVLPLYLIPPGTMVHNLSTMPDGRMQLCRSAGTFGQIVAHHGPRGEALGGADVLQMGGGLDDDHVRQKKMGSVLVKLQSGEVRRLEPGCVATIGVVSNKEHQQRQLGKAGRSRWLGKRPKVRGVAMNACDHPHGGGRGKSKGGKHPRSAKGVLQGVRTRRSKDKNGNKMVVSERPRGRASK